MNNILKAENVVISYTIGDFRDIGLKEWVIKHIKGSFNIQTFNAVNNVNLQLEKGDMLGIIGSNGSGKSTLLKAISGIMVPTQGNITVKGRVVALLELGSGFDGNLTVKENTYLRGAILGYDKAFIDREYNNIINFAELKDFENRPFKQLSSGMQSRLAFSIASFVQPEILILDEVLSVGDGAFQEKSEKKIRDIINNGATSILVSHSLQQIRELSTKILWLNKSKQIAFGSNVDDICDKYQMFLNGSLSLE